GISGHDLARRLREDHELRDMRLVALTGYGQEEDRRRSREAGFDEHLTKPVSLSRLREVLHCHNGNGKPAGSAPLTAAHCSTAPGGSGTSRSEGAAGTGGLGK